MKKTKIKSSGSFKKAVALVFKKGNVWALAVGVLIGSAFGAVVNSLANDIIMQAIAKAFDVHNVEGLSVDGIVYGKFLSALLSFLIITAFLVLFTWIAYVIWKRIQKKILRKGETQEVSIAPTTDQLILAELKKLNENLSKGNKAPKKVTKVTKVAKGRK